MARLKKEDLQAQQDIYRAQLLLCRHRGLEAHESAAALREHAETAEVSVHAAALAVLGEGSSIADQR